MKPLFIIILLILSSVELLSQDLGIIEDSKSRLFQIVENNDTINFIKFTPDTTSVKPVLLVLQGSLPIPLGIKYSGGISYTSFPYLLTDSILANYHIVVISMPNIPVIAKDDEIKGNGAYIKAPPEYNRANFLGNYVNRANVVISFLTQRSWVMPDKFVIFGHSQGSYVAIKLANENNQVHKIGISSCSPYGRYHQYLRQIRHNEHRGLLTHVEAQNKIEEYYKRWNHISQNRLDDSQEKGDTFKATFSFSENFVDDILRLRIPVFIAYGTNDIGALGCDILPIEFAKINKQDYELKSYIGLGHNFEEINSNGQSNFNRMHWDEVFHDFISWSKE